MTRRKYILITLLIYFYSPVSSAVYDVLSMNITPTEHDVTLCFYPDYIKEANTYLAAEVNGRFYFVARDLGLTPWSVGIEPPFLAQRINRFAIPKEEPICFESLPKASLHGISVYAGVGSSIGELVANGRYAKIYTESPVLPQTLKEWTVMIYLVGSTLEYGSKNYGSKDILEMLSGSIQPGMENVNVVIATGGSKRYGWSTIKRSLVQSGQQYVMEDLGIRKMSEAAVLSDFVTWAVANFPARHNALILWGHGNGRSGYGPDSSELGNQDLLTLRKLYQAFYTIRSQLGKKLDAVVYDACLMATLEVAQVTSAVTDVMGASVELEPEHGMDYAHLLTLLGTENPKNGLEFAKIAHKSYLNQSIVEHTYETEHITYSVFDLTRLPEFNQSLNNFANEFYRFLEYNAKGYTDWSQGIIRAPGYPADKAGKRSLEVDSNLRIDFYNILQTVGDGSPSFKQYADELLRQINNGLVVEYSANPNVTNIHPDAGRVSFDISTLETEHLAVLPEAYGILHDSLVYYSQLRQSDLFVPNSELRCHQGNICAKAQWLTLNANEILGIDGYFGQTTENGLVRIYLSKSLYRFNPALNSDSRIVADGTLACRYQLCTNNRECRDITLTEQQDQFLADIRLNNLPAVLSLCRDNKETWSACGVVQKLGSIWGRVEQVAGGDVITPTTLLYQNTDAPLQEQGAPLNVGEDGQVWLEKSCDSQKAVVIASYYGKNGRVPTEILCDSGDCVCQPGDTSRECQETGAKAGILLQQ